MTMKGLVSGSAVLCAFAAVAAEIIVPQVEVATAEGGTGRLDVSYRLDKPAVVTFDVLTNGVPVNADILGTAKGDVFRLVPAGSHAFSWKVYRAIPQDVVVEGAQVRVKAWSVGQPPDYMVIDLSVANGEIRYYDTAGQLPGGVGHNDYKSAKLVMRKIPAAYKWAQYGRTGVGEGSADTPHRGLMTADYYLGVYEFTAAQNTAMTVGETRTDPYPYRLTYGGAVAAVATCTARTGLAFRLPTPMEWEFACRAGTATDLYTGEDLAGNEVSPNLDAIAWYGYNSGEPAGALDTVAMHPVGLKAPNGFGLYDMLGNVWEFSRDNGGFRSWIECVEHDPGSSPAVIWAQRHGGAYDSRAIHCRATGNCPNHKDYSNDTQTGVNGVFNNNQGFRLCLPCRAVR